MFFLEYNHYFTFVFFSQQKMKVTNQFFGSKHHLLIHSRELCVLLTFDVGDCFASNQSIVMRAVLHVRGSLTWTTLL
jgi:hypothetical protein